MKSIIAKLSALGQQTRLQVVTLLGRGPTEGMSSGDLATLAGVPPNSMSTHLSILSAAGLVSAARNGRNVTYRIERRAVEDALDNLSARLGEPMPIPFTGAHLWEGVTPVAETNDRSRKAMGFALPVRWSCTANLRPATDHRSSRDIGRAPGLHAAGRIH